MQKLSCRVLFQNAGAVSAVALICYPADTTRSCGRRSPCPAGATMNRAIIILSCLIAMAVISHVTMRFAHGYVLTLHDQPSTAHASNIHASAPPLK